MENKTPDQMINDIQEGLDKVRDNFVNDISYWTSVYKSELNKLQESVNADGSNDRLLKMVEDGTVEKIIKNHGATFARDLGSQKDIVSNFELSLDFNNTVEVDDYEIDEESLAGAFEEALDRFMRDLLKALWKIS